MSASMCGEQCMKCNNLRCMRCRLRGLCIDTGAPGNRQLHVMGFFHPAGDLLHWGASPLSRRMSRLRPRYPRVKVWLLMEILHESLQSQGQTAASRTGVLV